MAGKAWNGMARRVLVRRDMERRVKNLTFAPQKAHKYQEKLKIKRNKMPQNVTSMV